ncbi:MAG TPA: hypothetical protein VFO37_04735 [Chitinophagaceae bacterium]|nr:hypothetical protein [Chitinophagaceae bacterium]
MKYKDKKGYDHKPDALCHKGKSYETAKDSKLPGQMYVPKKIHNESNFAAEKKSSY